MVVRSEAWWLWTAEARTFFFNLWKTCTKLPYPRLNQSFMVKPQYPRLLPFNDGAGWGLPAGPVQSTTPPMNILCFQMTHWPG